MSEVIVFKHENYNIASDIRLEADVAYIQGHPIVKTKTVVLYYRDSTFRASERKTDFTNSLITDLTRPQYIIELINYLSRVINHDNLFEIYVNNRNVEKHTLEEMTFAKQSSDDVRSSPDIDKNEYNEGLLDASKRFILKELLKTMNTRFTRTFASIEELDYVPIYGYISSSSAISRTSEPILHLAIVFNVLAHQEQFSGINNQEAIASFNSIMKAKRLNITAQDLNEDEYKNEIKRLKLKLKRKRENINRLETEKQKLEEENEELVIQSKVDTKHMQTLNAKIDKLHADIKELKAINLEQTETINELYVLSFDSKAELADMNKRLKAKDKYIKDFRSVANKAVHDISRITIKDQKLKMTNDILVLYISKCKPSSMTIRDEAGDGCIWIATYNGKESNFKYPNIPSDHEDIYRIESNRLDSYEYIVQTPSISHFIIRTYQRSILIDENSIDEFIDAIDAALNEDNTIPSIRTLDSVKAQINERKRDEHERNEAKHKKRELIKEYPKMHIVIGTFKRLVYACILNEENKEVYKSLSELDIETAIKSKWFYRYGKGGSTYARIHRCMLDSCRFTNQSDARIRYEN